MSLFQRTLRNPIQAQGVGLHSGRRVRLTLEPAPVDYGICFCRTDLPERPLLPAAVATVVDTHLATTLARAGVSVGTVEHLLAALAGVGIDNLLIRVDGPELPIMDGSAAPWVFLLEAAGLTEQPSPRRYLRILEPLLHVDGDVTAMLEPHDGFQLEYTLSYDHPVLRDHSNRVSVEFSSTSFRRELARARTFGLLEDLEALQAADLAKGGSLDNALVVDEDRILNEHGLRLRDEFARHKMLDAVGDLYLLGSPLLGAFRGHKSGHSANHKLLQKLVNKPEAWDVVTFTDPNALPGGYALEPLAATA